MADSEAHPPVVIRSLTSADVRRVRHLERIAYGSSTPRTSFERELRNGLAAYFVAIEIQDATQEHAASSGNERLLGPIDAGWWGSFCDYLRRLFPQPRELLSILGFAGVWYTHDQLHLVTIAVDPAEQGKGIGQALLLTVCDLAVEAEFDTIALELRASNDRALRLYEYFGFRCVGRLNSYYSDNNEDAIVMLLDGLADIDQPAALVNARSEYVRSHGSDFRVLRSC
jgi:ribosomal-protein-alanine acetyltransferase